MPKPEGDSGMKPRKIFKRAIRFLDIREAHKKQRNVARLHSLISVKLVMPKSESDSGVKPG